MRKRQGNVNPFLFWQQLASQLAHALATQAMPCVFCLLKAKKTPPKPLHRISCHCGNTPGTESLQWRGIRDTGHWLSLGSALTEQLWWDVKKSTNETNALKKNQMKNPSSFFPYSTLNQNMMKTKKCRKDVADYKVVQRINACFPHVFSCNGFQ